MTFAPVKSTKTYEAVTKQLQDNILNGFFPPGSKLPSVRVLSEEMSVSQSAVREALSALKAMRLVTMRQGEGTFVNQFSPEEITKSMLSVPLIALADIRALLELRKIIETGSARLASVRRTSEDVQRLQSIVQEMEQEIGSFTLGDETDWKFHYGIATASKNPFLVSLMDAIGERIQSSLRASRQALYQITGEAATLLEQHRRILEAISVQDGAVAELAMFDHLSHVEDALEPLKPSL